MMIRWPNVCVGVAAALLMVSGPARAEDIGNGAAWNGAAWNGSNWTSVPSTTETFTASLWPGTNRLKVTINTRRGSVVQPSVVGLTLGIVISGVTIPIRFETEESKVLPTGVNWSYFISVLNPQTLAWENLCGVDADGNKLETLFVKGVWDYTTGHKVSESGATLACRRGGSLAKALDAGFLAHELNYYITVKDPVNGTITYAYQDMSWYHQAANAAVRYAPCLDVSYTQTGMLIDIFALGMVAAEANSGGYTVESEWAASGAVAMHHQRVKELQSVPGQPYWCIPPSIVEGEANYAHDCVQNAEVAIANATLTTDEFVKCGHRVFVESCIYNDLHKCDPALPLDGPIDILPGGGGTRGGGGGGTTDVKSGTTTIKTDTRSGTTTSPTGTTTTTTSTPTADRSGG